MIAIWRATSASIGNGSHVDSTAESVASLPARSASSAKRTPSVSSANVTTDTSVARPIDHLLVARRATMPSWPETSPNGNFGTTAGRS